MSLLNTYISPNPLYETESTKHNTDKIDVSRENTTLYWRLKKKSPGLKPRGKLEQPIISLTIYEKKKLYQSGLSPITGKRPIGSR